MKNLTKQRRERNWKQAELAEKVNSTKQAVCNWEKGRCFPKRHTLILLENLFDMSHQDLFAEIPDGTMRLSKKQ